ncbi:hypothetical protein N9L68_06480 [bacterium]|nr:hypothetical protein [bacterium]
MMRCRATSRHSRVVESVLFLAANGLGTGGCIGARIGQCVAKLETAIESSFTITIWWKTGYPKAISTYESSGVDRTNWQEVAGKKQ